MEIYAVTLTVMLVYPKSVAEYTFSYFEAASIVIKLFVALSTPFTVKANTYTMSSVEHRSDPSENS
jgi:hypothetical protein